MDEAIDMNEIIQSLENVSGDISVFLDTETGDLITLTEAEILTAEADRDKGGDSDDDLDDMEGGLSDDLADDLDEGPGGPLARSQAKSIIEDEDGRYIALPNDRELNKWQIVKDYCHTLKDAKVKGELEDIIRGAGSFIKLDNCLQRHKLDDDWYNFQHKALRDIAADWCNENNVKFKE